MSCLAFTCVSLYISCCARTILVQAGKDTGTEKKPAEQPTALHQVVTAKLSGKLTQGVIIILIGKAQSEGAEGFGIVGVRGAAEIYQHQLMQNQVGNPRQLIFISRVDVDDEAVLGLWASLTKSCGRCATKRARPTCSAALWVRTGGSNPSKEARPDPFPQSGKRRRRISLPVHSLKCSQRAGVLPLANAWRPCHSTWPSSGDRRQGRR